ncbi:TPA: DNA-protecting protein DprA [Candidatus Falkowbacteria bacterium]|nr:DNA-protecting protein DprA [Candidatus Falkowbacteria bacterium]
MDQNELQYWVALNQISSIGAATMKKLYNYFPDFATLWLESTETDLLSAGLDSKNAELLLTRKHLIEPAAEMEKLLKENITAITIADPEYPSALKEIHHPPALLYCKGNLDLFRSECLAVVGTRHMTPYGSQMAEQFTVELVANNLTTVSGLALGIDTIVHHTTIKNNGYTIAVLGSGLDQKNLYPSSNRSLANNIVAQNGLIISEFPLGTLPLRHHFPIRNRIISGLSRGTLVIEAGESSGALITAKYALDQNREVFAVPGNITNPYSIGPNNLIKQGAIAVSNVVDILDSLNLKSVSASAPRQKPTPANDQEKIILTHLNLEPIHFNDLRRRTGLTASDLNAALSMLEITGKIKNAGAGEYIVNYH